MKIRRFVQAALIVGVAFFVMAATASASTITYTTNGSGTGFNGTSTLILNSGFGPGTLTFIPNSSSISGVPSNINLGDFLLACPGCTTQAGGLGVNFAAFTFNLLVTDTTDGATGRFVGTSTGGSVWSDVSQVTINWSPLQLGPGTSNALSGNFGTTVFTTSTFTGLAAPNSGSPAGDTTVQGTVNTASAVPEPATLSLMGGALLGLGFMLRRKRS